MNVAVNVEAGLLVRAPRVRIVDLERQEGPAFEAAADLDELRQAAEAFGRSLEIRLDFLDVVIVVEGDQSLLCAGCGAGEQCRPGYGEGAEQQRQDNRFRGLQAHIVASLQGQNGHTRGISNDVISQNSSVRGPPKRAKSTNL